MNKKQKARASELVEKIYSTAEAFFDVFWDELRTGENPGLSSHNPGVKEAKAELLALIRGEK